MRKVLYKCCGKCQKEFVASHFKEHRFATGRYVSCCSETARFIKTIEDKE